MVIFNDSTFISINTRRFLCLETVRGLEVLHRFVLDGRRWRSWGGCIAYKFKLPAIMCGSQISTYRVLYPAIRLGSIDLQKHSGN